MKEGCFMAFNKYGKIIDITLAVAGVAVPIITKMRSDKKAKIELAKTVSEEVAKQLATRK